MILVPEETLKSNKVPTGGIKKKRIERDINKIEKLLNIVLKIAAHKGYNEEFQIYDRNGDPISNSNIVSLVNYALSHESTKVGESDFVRILFESNVNPNWIINENLRQKLVNYTSTPYNARPSSPTAPQVSSDNDDDDDDDNNDNNSGNIENLFSDTIEESEENQPNQNTTYVKQFHGVPKRKFKKAIRNHERPEQRIPNVNPISTEMKSTEPIKRHKERDSAEEEVLNEMNLGPTVPKNRTPAWAVPLPESDDDELL